jgi:hypothetical protein
MSVIDRKVKNDPMVIFALCQWTLLALLLFVNLASHEEKIVALDAAHAAEA